MGTICEFCGATLKNQKAVYYHKKKCKKYKEYKKKMVEIEKVIKNHISKGYDIEDLFTAEESFVKSMIYDINKQIGDIRGFLQRILSILENLK